MNKRNLLAVLLVCVMVGTAAFADNALSLGGSYVQVVDENDEEIKDVGFEAFGKLNFAEYPKLSIAGRLAQVDQNKNEEKAATLNEYTAGVEYLVSNEDQVAFAVKGGWLGTKEQGVAVGEGEDAIKPDPVKENYLAVGGKVTLDLGQGLDFVGDVTYGFNSLFKAEDDPELTVLRTKVGAEYAIASVPGFKLHANYLYNKNTSDAKIDTGEPDTETGEPILGDTPDVTKAGFSVGASYSFNF